MTVIATMRITPITGETARSSSLPTKMFLYFPMFMANSFKIEVGTSNLRFSTVICDNGNSSYSTRNIGFILKTIIRF